MASKIALNFVCFPSIIFNFKTVLMSQAWIKQDKKQKQGIIGDKPEH